MFGWDVHTASDSPDFRYSTFGPEESAHAGVMDATVLPGATPSSWRVYFQVDDIEATVARAEELGGGVDQSPVDSPYGKLAVLHDPMGARFSLQQP